MKRLIRLCCLGLSLLAFVSEAQAGQTNYFLVAPTHPVVRRERGDSYVLPLTRESDIEWARHIIEVGPGTAERLIVEARISRGNEGAVNRNYLASGAPLWSWHVSEFIRFTDSAPGIGDGWPGWVERELDYCLEIGGISFSAYTVIAELGPVPLWLQHSYEDQVLHLK
jgi:hypothetical protein